MEWITKKVNRPVSRNVANVSVSIANTKRGNKTRTRFIFRNECYKKITGCEHIVVAFTGTRIYFRNAEPKEGFKLCGRMDCNSTVRYVTITGDYSGFIGDYDLLIDRSNGLYYIDSGFRKR